MGSGGLRDSKLLLERGFKVTAIDYESVDFSHPNFSFIKGAIENYVFPREYYDVVNFQYSVPFVHRDHFPLVWNRMGSSLKKGGILTGQLFGNEDEWNTPKSTMSFHSSEEVFSLLKELRIISLKEEKRFKDTVHGKNKFWHIFHVIAEK